MVNSLGTKLKAVDSRYAESVHLEDMTEWRLDDPLGGRLPNKLPCGWVVTPRLTIDQWSSDNSYMASDVIVWALIRDQMTEILKQKMYRTTQAIWETLRDGHFDGSIEWQILDSPEMDYSEILTGPGGIQLADARVRVRMYTREMA